MGKITVCDRLNPPPPDCFDIQLLLLLKLSVAQLVPLDAVFRVILLSMVFCQMMLR